MNWFQRYGIPGTYFWGLLILWCAAFYHCEFTEITQNADTVKIIAGIIGASFLPLGYLISIFAQFLYLSVLSRILGCHYRAVAVTKGTLRPYFPSIDFGGMSEFQLEVLAAMFCTTDRLSLEATKFLQEWIRQRTALLAINGAIVLGTLLAFLSALIFPLFLGQRIQIDSGWAQLAWGVSIFSVFVCSINYLVIHWQVSRIIAGHLRLLAGINNVAPVVQNGHVMRHVLLAIGILVIGFVVPLFWWLLPGLSALVRILSELWFWWGECTIQFMRSLFEWSVLPDWMEILACRCFCTSPRF